MKAKLSAMGFIFGYFVVTSPLIAYLQFTWFESFCWANLGLLGSLFCYWMERRKKI